MSGAINWIGKGIGSLTGATQMDTANKLNRRALAVQERAYNEQSAFSKALQRIVQGAKAAGRFDPEARIASADRDANLALDQSLTSSAAADRIAGRRDAASGLRRDRIVAQASNDRARRNDEIRNAVLQDELNANTMTMPQFSQSNALSQAYQNAAANYQNLAGQAAQGTLGLVGAVQGFMNRKKKGRAFGYQNPDGATDY